MNRKGSVFFGIFSALFLVAFLIFVFVYSRGGPDAKPSKHADEKIVRLEEEIGRLLISLDEAESIRDREKYLEILGLADKKYAESDSLWEADLMARQGTVDGMMGGMNEIYEARFTNADKFAMLSEKYGVPVDQLRLLKADLEIMFAMEYSEKFTPAPEE